MKNIYLVSAVLLLAGIPVWLPSVYYLILRVIIFSGSICVLYQLFQSKTKKWWHLIFGIIALIYNPLFLVNLEKIYWIPIDLISSILFFILVFFPKTKHSHKK